MNNGLFRENFIGGIALYFIFAGWAGLYLFILHQVRILEGSKHLVHYLFIFFE